MENELNLCLCGKNPTVIPTNVGWVGHIQGHIQSAGKFGCRDCNITYINCSPSDIIYSPEKDEYEFKDNWDFQQQIEIWNSFISKLKTKINDSK